MSDHQNQVYEQDQAEDLDEDKLGDVDYPPEQPVGVDDPTQDSKVTDSITEREQREQPEAAPGTAMPAGAQDPEAVVLVEPDEGARPDVEKDVVGDDAKPGVPGSNELANDSVPPPAEEDAVHVDET